MRRLSALLLGLVLAAAASAHDVQESASHPPKVEASKLAIGAMLESHPEMVVDLSKTSGEYCVNTWNVGGGHMTHYAIDPSRSREDVIEFVRLDSFPGHVDVSALPRLPGELGRMKPNQWYHLPVGGYDPHHATRFPFALLIRATNVE